MKRLTCMLLALGYGLSHSAMADTIMIEPVADSTIDALNPDLVTNTGNLSASMMGTNGMPATELKTSYMQYQLPDGLTGQGIASVESVDIQLYRSAAAPALSLTYYVYGVFEGFDEESADTYSWNSGVGIDPSHKDVVFPDVNEISYYADPAEAGYVGFIDTASEGPPLRPFGFFPTQSTTAIANLNNLFLNDTDGKITFYFKVRPNFAVTPLQTFASLEHPDYAAPTLILNYTPGTRAIPGDYDGSGVVDGLDLDLWEAQFGQTGETVESDGDGNDVVDGNDFLFWQRNLAVPIASAATSVVPEPITLCSALGGLAIVIVRGRRATRTRRPA
jgi:hypothetical protein